MHCAMSQSEHIMLLQAGCSGRLDGSEPPGNGIPGPGTIGTGNQESAGVGGHRSLGEESQTWAAGKDA